MKLFFQKLSFLIYLIHWKCHAESIPSWNRFWEYKNDNTTNQPVPRTSQSMTLDSESDLIYVYGGVENSIESAFSDLWEFDLLKKSWKEIKTISSPPARYAHSCILSVSNQSKILYIFGGVSAKQDTSGNSKSIEPADQNDMWYLNLSDSNNLKWNEIVPKEKEPWPLQRSEASTVNYKENMYIYGGIVYDATLSSPKAYDDLWVFNSDKKSWKHIQPKEGDEWPVPRFSHSSTLIKENDKFYMAVYGGRVLEGSNWAMLSELWLYSFESNKWFLKDTIPNVSRCYNSMVSVGNNVWMFGGYVRNDYTSNGYVFDDIMTSNVSASEDSKVNWHSAIVNDSESVISPIVSYSHQAILWNNLMIIYGGRYIDVNGHMWALNITNIKLIDVVDNPFIGGKEMFIATHFVLAAMVGLMISLCVFVYVTLRYYHRALLNHRRQSAIASTDVQDVGLTDEKLKATREFQYSPKELKSYSFEDDEEEEENVCCICLGGFEENQNVRELPCKHLFHKDCVDKWFQKHTTCPMCKLDLEGTHHEDTISHESTVNIDIQ